jgi:NAD(P)H-nitrite reductase large subunit
VRLALPSGRTAFRERQLVGCPGQLMTQYVIVGLGAAGFSAAETIRQTVPRASITLLTDEPYGYYSRPGLAYVLTNEVPMRQLFPRSDDELERMGIDIIRTRAERLDPRNRRIILSRSRSLAYDKLLLATGAGAILPPIPGTELPGVVTLDTMDDAYRILRLARRAKTAVVIGGGITALELVEGLNAQNVRVHYLLRRERFWSSVLDPAESRLVERRLAHEGVQIHRHTKVGQILSRKDWRGRRSVAGVETQDGRRIGCQIVAVAVGVRPRLDLVADTNIETDRGVLVNDYLETSVPGIFCAGDVAQALDPLTRKHKLDVLWPVAVAQGRVAGANMVGTQTRYDKGLSTNVTRLAGMIVTLIGAVAGHSEPDDDLLTISRGDSEVWRGFPQVLVVNLQHEINRQRLIIKDRRLVGAILFGDHTVAPLLQRMITEQVDIGPMLGDLQVPDAKLTDLLQRHSWMRRLSVPSRRNGRPYHSGLSSGS